MDTFLNEQTTKVSRESTGKFLSFGFYLCIICLLLWTCHSLIRMLPCVLIMRQVSDQKWHLRFHIWIFSVKKKKEFLLRLMLVLPHIAYSSFLICLQLICTLYCQRNPWHSSSSSSYLSRFQKLFKRISWINHSFQVNINTSVLLNCTRIQN